MVCKAFKKHNPIQKQRFEAWNNGYYIRNTRPLPLINPYQSFNSNQSRNSHQLSFGDPQQLSSSNNFLLESSKIDSPSASRSFATNEGHEYDDGIDLKHYDNDWKYIENFLESELDKPNSFPNSTLPLNVSNNDNDDLDSYNQTSHLFGCFSDL